MAQKKTDGLKEGDHVVFDSTDPRPYSLDTEGRRWLLDGSGDVA